MTKKRDSPASWVRPTPVSLPTVEVGGGRGPRLAAVGVVVAGLLLIGGLGYAGFRISQDPDDRAEASGSVDPLKELEARWAKKRAAVVAELSSSAYGVDDQNVLRGPAGFEVDLDECPPTWSDTAGAGSGPIRFGNVSGSPADPNDIAVGMEAYFEYVNANGGIGGRSVELTVKDGWADPDRTIVATDELIAEDALVVSTLGTPSSLAVVDTLNEACVPHLVVDSLYPGWGDPEQYPFTTGADYSYVTEARIWGAWIEQEFADDLPIRVSAVVTDDELALLYQAAFEQWVAEHPGVVSVLTIVPHPQADFDFGPEVARAFSAPPTVFISMTSGVSCLSLLQEIERQGFRDELGAHIRGGLCDPFTSLALGGQGDDELVTFPWSPQKRSTYSSFADDPFVSFVNEQLAAAGIDPETGRYGDGFGLYGWAYVELLRIADALPGGMSRSNLLLAMRGMQLEHPMLLDGVRFGMWGNDDAFPVEAAEVVRYDVAKDRWVNTGEIIDVDGATPNCAGDGSSGCS